MTVDWNRFKGKFVKWETIGQLVDGDVTSVSMASFQGNEFPQLTLRTADGEQIVSANQSRLQRALADDPPNIGDRVKIEYLGEAGNAQPGMNPAKLFQVTVTHRQGTPTADSIV